jgi:16S rRNA (cytidine1402-2'-O)-methyltransferase
LPGASSVTTALSVAGVVEGEGHFIFAGFPPSKAGERSTWMQTWAAETRAIVMLEAPHRIEALAKSLAELGTRPLTVGRELSKQFEQIITLPANTFGHWLAEDEVRQRGEFVLVLHPQPPSNQDAHALRVLDLLLAELPLKSAVRLCAEITGQARNALYEQALQRRAASDPD